MLFLNSVLLQDTSAFGEKGEGREKPGKPWGVREGPSQMGVESLLDREKTGATGLECEGQRQGWSHDSS